MGINIAICELEAKNAACRELKQNIIKVLVSDASAFGNAAETDMYVTLEDAKKAFPDWDAFVKRNRLNEDSDAVYMDKVKNDDDAATLSKIAKKRFTGWVLMKDLDENSKKKAIDMSDKENRVTGWDRLEFDEMNEKCGKCPLSWDKGRGCIGAFGPDNSLLPEIASKHGCPIVASAPESSKTQKKFSSDDAPKLAKEVEILTAALPDEGKVYVRRYSGPLERLAAVAKISSEEKCGFYFF
jgi:hypothetical protein